MYPWRRILIPTDFSTASEWVFDDAIRIAGSTGAEIVILHIRNETNFPADSKVFEYAEEFELSKLRDRVKRANASIPARLVVKKSGESPGDEIVRSIAEESVDLVVMATHARHHVAHLLLGSTTRNVITDPPAPVLAIRYGIHKRRAMRRIVVPVHTKQKTHAALELAATIAAREQGELHLLTICNAGEKSRAETLQSSVSTTITTPIKNAILVGDDIEKELARYSEHNDVDAVFLNAADSPSPLKIDIIRGVPAPVMIVPAS